VWRQPSCRSLAELKSDLEAHGGDRPRAEAEAAIAGLYGGIGAEAPRFLWVESPASAALASLLQQFVAATPTASSGRRTERGDWMWDEIYDRLCARLWPNNGLQRGAQLRAQIYGDRLSPSRLGAHLEAQLGRQLENFQAGDFLGNRLTRPADTQGVDQSVWEFVSTCWPYERLCVISERPSAIQWDQAGKLHCASVPAVRFRDGFELYMWHGTEVPASWITAPDELDPRCALTWPNLEQRRAAADIVGWKRVLEELHPRTLDKSHDPAIGELLAVDLPDAGPARFLKVRCRTGREFVLAVPRDMQTALQANAWTYGLDPNEYDLEVRT
jgi:hypothetical protein